MCLSANTPKLELLIFLNVYYKNTLPEGRKHLRMKKVGRPPNLNTIIPVKNLQQYFLTETSVKRLIVVKNEIK